jgi:hypothetical protein
MMPREPPGTIAICCRFEPKSPVGNSEICKHQSEAWLGRTECRHEPHRIIRLHVDVERLTRGRFDGDLRCFPVTLLAPVPGSPRVPQLSLGCLTWQRGIQKRSTRLPLIAARRGAPVCAPPGATTPTRSKRWSTRRAARCCSAAKWSTRSPPHDRRVPARHRNGRRPRRRPGQPAQTRVSRKAHSGRLAPRGTGKGGGGTGRVEEQPHALRNYLTTRHPDGALMLLIAISASPALPKWRGTA